MVRNTSATRIIEERKAEEAAAPPAEGTQAGQKPIARVMLGGVQASIWANHSDKGDFHSVTFTRRYQDGGEWKSSNSYGPTDLLLLQKVADLAVNKIIELQQGRGRAA